MQTPEEIVKAWYPQAEICHRDGDGALVMTPMAGAGKSYIWIGSKIFPMNTPCELLWEDAYAHLAERAKILLYNYRKKTW